jgi:hypothetical protein
MAVFALVPAALAQESRGSITGKVSDPQNSLMPGVSVMLTNTLTNTVSRTHQPLSNVK